MPDERRSPGPGGRRSSDDTLIWRGQISEQVRQHEKDLKDIRDELVELDRDVRNLGRSMSEMHERLDNVADQLDKGLRDINANLSGLTGGRAALFTSVTAPVLVGIILAVVALALQGH